MPLRWASGDGCRGRTAWCHGTWRRAAASPASSGPDIGAHNASAIASTRRARAPRRGVRSTPWQQDDPAGSAHADMVFSIVHYRHRAALYNFVFRAVLCYGLTYLYGSPDKFNFIYLTFHTDTRVDFTRNTRVSLHRLAASLAASFSRDGDPGSLHNTHSQQASTETLTRQTRHTCRHVHWSSEVQVRTCPSLYAPYKLGPHAALQEFGGVWLRVHRLERAVAVPHDGRRGEAAPDDGERQEQVEQPQPSEL